MKRPQKSTECNIIICKVQAEEKGMSWRHLENRQKIENHNTQIPCSVLNFQVSECAVILVNNFTKSRSICCCLKKSNLLRSQCYLHKLDVITNTDSVCADENRMMMWASKITSSTRRKHLVVQFMSMSTIPHSWETNNPSRTQDPEHKARDDETGKKKKWCNTIATNKIKPRSQQDQIWRFIYFTYVHSWWRFVTQWRHQRGEGRDSSHMAMVRWELILVP